MKKAKRLAIIVCAIAMLMSILAIPASAAVCLGNDRVEKS